MDISFSVGPDIRRGCMRWGPGESSGEPGELGKAWAGTAMLDPLFEQQAHSRRSMCAARQMWMRLFPSSQVKCGSSRVESRTARKRRGLVCGSVWPVALRDKDKVAFEVSFSVGEWR